jgi:hypothetical protein
MTAAFQAAGIEEEAGRMPALQKRAAKMAAVQNTKESRQDAGGTK